MSYYNRVALAEREWTAGNVGRAVEILDDCPDFRTVIQLNIAPHFSTLHKAADRFFRKGLANKLLDATLVQARQTKLPRTKQCLAAIDSSGFEAHHTSHYFVRRRAQGQENGKRMTYRRFPKLGIVVDCSNHLILAAVPGSAGGRGPRPDFGHLVRAVEEAHHRRRLTTLLADAGYDAEWVHKFLREQLSIRSVIPPRSGRPTAKLPPSRYRRLMAQQFDKPTYGQRWQSETVFSMMKRRLGPILGARSYRRQVRALMLKAITHNILIVQRLSKLFYRAGQAYLISQANFRRSRSQFKQRGFPNSRPALLRDHDAPCSQCLCGLKSAQHPGTNW